MAGFAPQLQSNIGYDAPINEGAGGLGVLSSLSSLLPAKKAAKAPAKPTKDERLGKGWRENFADTSIQEASLADIRKFGRLFPDGGPAWIKTQANALNNVALNEETEAQDNQNAQTAKIALEWNSSPQYILARDASQKLPKDDQDLFLAEAELNFWKNSANKIALERRVRLRGAQAGDREDAFRFGSVSSRSLADAASFALGDFAEASAMDSGASINLDEVMGLGAILPSMAGMTLTKNNTEEFSSKLREGLMTKFLDQMSQDSGIPRDQLGLMPKEVESKIFGAFDAKVIWSANHVDPSEVKRRSIDNDFNAMVEADLPLAFISNVAIVSAADPKLKATILSTMSEHGGRILEMYESGEYDFVKAAVKKLSSEERNRSFAALSQMAKAWGGKSTVAKIYEEVPQLTRDLNFANTSMAAVEMAKGEMGDNLLLGPNFWKENIEGTAHMWEGAMKAQPEFKPAMIATLTGDINANMTFVDTAAEKLGYVAVMSDAGVITLAHGGPTHKLNMAQFAETIERNKERDPAAVSGVEAARDAYLSEVPKSLFATIGEEEVDVLKGANYRYNAVSNLGEIGKQVRLNVDTHFSQDIGDEAMAELDKGKGSVNAGGITKSTLPPKESDAPASVSNGPISQSVGVDFGAIEQEYSLPTGFLERTAQIESGGDPSEENPNSSAGGLFQQIDSNAKEFGVTDRFNPEQSTIGAAKFAKQNAAKLRKVLGREPTGAELYLAHQQGGGGAAMLLRNRSRPVNTLLSNDAITLNGGSLDMTAGEFADLWINKWNSGGGGRATNASQTATPPSRDFNTETDAAMNQALDNQPEVTDRLGIAPVGSASEAGAFVATPTGEGENLLTDRTGGEAQKPPTPKARPASERLRENVNPKTARQLKSLGIKAEEVDHFASQEEAQEAINRGELKEGDAMMVDGELFIIEGV